MGKAMELKHVIVVGLLACLAACAPKNYAQFPKAPPGPPEYQQGWQDGCESGYSTYGNSMYKTFYHYKMDPNLRNNDIYYRTWNDAFNYCRAWVKHDQAHGMTALGGFNPRNPDPFFDLRDPRPVTDPQTFSFPLWNNDTALPTFGDDPENLWDGESFE
jgi:hypothetical protein